MIYEIKTVDGVKTKVPLTGNGYGLPLGTWISYEGTCPDGFIESEQTFNTTTYSALYAMLGSNKVPARFDHSVLSDWEDVTISTDANNPTVMQYDGFYTLSIGSSGAGSSLKVYVNGIQIEGSGTGGQYTSVTGQLTIPFKKGDSIYKVNSSTTIMIEKVAYYKRHLAIKATPAYVEPDTVSDMVNTLRTQDSYSLEEVNTGKKWIDGKPIYRKCYSGLTISFSINEGWQSLGITAPLNVDTIIKGKCYGTDATSPYSSHDIPFNPALVAIGSNNTLFRYNTLNLGVIHSVVIEYTKTTD